MPNQKLSLQLLNQLSKHVKNVFAEKKNILTFEEYFETLISAPVRHTRSAYEYVIDMINYFGQRTDEDGNTLPGFKLFEQEFYNGVGAVRGHAEIEHQILNLLEGFKRVGRADKLILLHGPNGSAKTSLVACLHRGLEEYSKHSEGAVYRFNWIFPDENFNRDKIGFSKSSENDLSSTSFAHLPDDSIAARIVCPLNDNPLFLVTRTERHLLFDELANTNDDFVNHDLSDHILNGDLSPKNRQIFDALLTVYKGDYKRVVQHVQVERYYLSERYKVGSVTIEPQMSVDARIQQVTADRSLSSLPPVLQNLSIFEPSGHLIQANHGLIEYSDLLKRPVDAYKYLLGTCEKGTVNLDAALIYLDLVMIGSSNDKYLEGFKQLPDFTSFKGRIELIKVPYLRDFTKEQKIYEEQLELSSENTVLSPHLEEIVALWVTLTRLKKPVAEKYPEPVRPVILKMNPLEKALYYAFGRSPEWTTIAQAKELKNVRGLMLNEHNGDQNYEGGAGASPREGKMILQSAVQNKRDKAVTAAHVFGEIKRIINNPTLFEWLQIEPDGEFGKQEALLKYVQDYYIAIVDKELKVSMEMIEESQYIHLLERYVEQASAWIQKTKVTDPVSGTEKPVDENLLAEVEQIIAPSESAINFRHDVVSRVGAYSLDNPDSTMDYHRIFQQQIGRMEEHYFTRQKTRISKMHEHLLIYLSDRKGELQEEEIAQVEKMFKIMKQRYSYAPECTREVVSLLMKTRYAKGAVS